MTMRIGALVLAAGESRRMGEAKQLLTFGTKRLLDLALSAVSLPELVDSTLVLGAHAEAIKDAMWLDEFEVVNNARWAEGMITSVKAGVAMLKGRVDWAIVLPCDYALVERNTVARLALRAACVDEPCRIISPVCYGQSGHPILLHHSLFDDVLNLNEGVGLDAVVQAYADARERVEVTDSGVLFDIDTPDDYDRALQAWNTREQAASAFVKHLSEDPS